MPYLIVIGGEKKNIVHPVRSEGCCLGRGLNGTVHINLDHDGYVSRRGEDEDGTTLAHAEIFCHIEFGWSLCDLGSQNGTITVCPRTGQPSILAHEAAMKMGNACLFQIGMSALLFLNLDERPSDCLVQALSRDDQQTVRLSAEVSHFGDGGDRSTAGDGPPQSHNDAICALWAHVQSVLQTKGLDDILFRSIR